MLIPSDQDVWLKTQLQRRIGYLVGLLAVLAEERSEPHQFSLKWNDLIVEVA